MKALSLSRPWTTAVERHGKRVENRTRWAPHPHLTSRARRIVGETIALHSSGTYDGQGAVAIQRITGILYGPKDTPIKAVTSVVKVAGLLLPGDVCPDGQEAWYFGSLAFLLDDVRPLAHPVPIAGGLGLWNLPAEVLARVEEQL